MDGHVLFLGNFLDIFGLRLKTAGLSYDTRERDGFAVRLDHSKLEYTFSKCKALKKLCL